MGRRSGIPGVSIYKPVARGKPHHRWLIQYKEDGRKRTETVSTDLEVTRHYAMEVSRRLERRRLGLVTAADRKLAEAEARPLTDHAGEFRDWLVSKGKTAKYAGEVHSRLLKLTAGCGFARVSDLSRSVAQGWVGEQRDERDWSAETSNKYLKDAKHFWKWLKKEDRAAGHPLEFLALFNVEADRRHVRRALDPVEFAALVAAARVGAVYGMDNGDVSGPDRAVLYQVAAYTGLRAKELASLTPESFDLDAATVTVRAAHSKHRRTDVLPLRADLVALLRPWLEGRPRTRRLWRLPDKCSLMIKADLAAAGVPYETPAGTADFHALRHTFITNLGRQADVSMKTVQQLARHSDIRLTARYMHMTRHDELAALGGLPALPPARRDDDQDGQQQLATGTDGPAPPAPAGAGGAGHSALPSRFPTRPDVSRPVPPRRGSADAQPPGKSGGTAPANHLTGAGGPPAGLGLRSRRLEVRALSGTLPQPQPGPGTCAGAAPAAAGGRAPISAHSARDYPAAPDGSPAAAGDAELPSAGLPPAETLPHVQPPPPPSYPAAPAAPAPAPSPLDLNAIRALHAQLSALLAATGTPAPAPPSPPPTKEDNP